MKNEKWPALALGFWLGCAWTMPADNIPDHWNFAFAPANPPSSGMVTVETTNEYQSGQAWGFDPRFPAHSLPGGGVTADQPFYFSAMLPEGNYRVTVGLGSAEEASTNTIKAEARRLMLENLVTEPGQVKDISFVVNIRTPEYPGGHVHLKPRELTSEQVTWDRALTLEFNGSHPIIQTLEIAPARHVTTIYLAGDSTVCDQPLEPWNSWGQMLPRFFDDRVAVANYAESGESLRSSLASHRFDKIFSRIQPGDYLFVQFGHNDMKDKAPDALERYSTNLKKVVEEARAHGAIPVLVTSMERKAGAQRPTLAGYPDAVRSVSRECGTALIDLNRSSVELYRALGPDLGRAFQDGTHHNNYGSYELAQCVVTGIRKNVPALAAFLDPALPVFNPARPDPASLFHLPESPLHDSRKPEGN